MPLLDSRFPRPASSGFLPPAGFVLVAAGDQLPPAHALPDREPELPAPTPKMSVMAVIAFTAAVLFPPLALVLGPMAMVEIKRNPGLRGNGLAAYATFATYLPLLIVPVGFLTVYILHLAIGSPMFVDLASLVPLF